MGGLFNPVLMSRATPANPSPAAPRTPLEAWTRQHASTFAALCNDFTTRTQAMVTPPSTQAVADATTPTQHIADVRAQAANPSASLENVVVPTPASPVSAPVAPDPADTTPKRTASERDPPTPSGAQTPSDQSRTITPKKSHPDLISQLQLQAQVVKLNARVKELKAQMKAMQHELLGIPFLDGRDAHVTLELDKHRLDFMINEGVSGYQKRYKNHKSLQAEVVTNEHERVDAAQRQWTRRVKIFALEERLETDEKRHGKAALIDSAKKHVHNRKMAMAAAEEARRQKAADKAAASEEQARLRFERANLSGGLSMALLTSGAASTGLVVKRPSTRTHLNSKDVQKRKKVDRNLQFVDDEAEDATGDTTSPSDSEEKEDEDEGMGEVDAGVTQVNANQLMD